MKSEFDLMIFIEKVCSFSPRLGKNEQLTASYLKKILDEQGVEYFSQKFEATIPEWGKAELFADGEKIECKNTSLVSGRIDGKDNIVSSFPYLNDAKTNYNINFSPYVDAICTVGFYEHPSVAIKFSDLSKVLKAKNAHGEVEVRKYSYTSENILVGNKKNPKFLVFSHYDCIGNGGAVDNASSVATSMFTIINHPEILENTLFIFSGCEEISYDEHDQSGLGYRKFEENFSLLISDAERIYVLDGLGNSEPHFTNEYSWLEITLQIKQLESVKDKTFLMQCEVDKILEVYHSDNDTCDKMKVDYLIKSSQLLLSDIEKVLK
ncbi:MAG: hypothetical protein US57_C0015G0005 [Candidatus Moranbacteria bacterium GW2011_GWC2_37_73]|nr:MAG: hypothetical protein UR95_C0006G0007 [Parcubacteria group bacterium GW2011_GWC1_36_108]KKQ39315.1 MAG: hypothetical protein US57_C0015G0005 [Candidatus Moranbacteria bacterium GW2011_GWC2_37_73]